MLTSCDKNDSQAYETKMRIASYYGFMFDGESGMPVVMLLGCNDGRWEPLYPIAGFDYEEGFEYEISVRVEPVNNPPMGGSNRTISLIEVIGKVEKQTDDCPLQSWDEFVAEHPEWAEANE